MRFTHIGLANYRNIAFARLNVDAPRVFFLGRNGQGKTNFLEAAGYLTSLRSFRARENETLIGTQAAQAEIAYELEHESHGETRAQVRIKRKGKEVLLDGESVKRASDFVGRFPTVTLSSEDLGVVRGAPAGRRRFLDTLLCGSDRSYYAALSRYQRGLQERNALLKRGTTEALLNSFERQLPEPALEVIAKRARAVEALASVGDRFYRSFSEGQEQLGIVYRPNASPESESAYLSMLGRQRARDMALHSTSRGPHRDDFDLTIDGRAASDYASEGQQRSIALALSFAAMELWKARFGIAPVLLVDDVLGELDPERRRRFWSILDPSIQLIATGTELPPREEGVTWLIYDVTGGAFAPRAG